MVTSAWRCYEKTTGKTSHINNNNFLTMTDPFGSMICEAGLYRALQWTNPFHTHELITSSQEVHEGGRPWNITVI